MQLYYRYMMNLERYTEDGNLAWSKLKEFTKIHLQLPAPEQKNTAGVFLDSQAQPQTAEKNHRNMSTHY